MRNSGPNLVPYYLYFGGMANQSKRRERSTKPLQHLKSAGPARDLGGWLQRKQKLNYSIKIQPGLNDLQLNLEPKWLTSQLSKNI